MHRQETRVRKDGDQEKGMGEERKREGNRSQGPFIDPLVVFLAFIRAVVRQYQWRCFIDHIRLPIRRGLCRCSAHWTRFLVWYSVLDNVLFDCLCVVTAYIELKSNEQRFTELVDNAFFDYLYVAPTLPEI
mmetsp:Transcript_610/g.1252  ORF Transcript_610/g.1252 Transcript_610/m.1252 type:complete len:131 (+) Transcript_610:791-1183(+)